MQRRWTEWALIGFLVFYFSLPFWRYNLHVFSVFLILPARPSLILSAGHWPHFTAVLLALVEVWAFVGAARVIAALMRWNQQTLSLQIQLSTGWVLMVAASVLLFLNLRGNANDVNFVKYGFPENIYYRIGDDFSAWYLVVWHWNLFVALTVLGLVVLICEKILWPRAASTIAAAPRAASTARPDAMSSRERWISSVPLFLLFALIWSCGIPIRSIPDQYTYYREFGVFGHLFLSLAAVCEQHYISVAVAMILITWFYFHTICRDRLYARIFNKMLWVLLFLILLTLTLQLTSTYFPFAKGMRRK